MNLLINRLNNLTKIIISTYICTLSFKIVSEKDNLMRCFFKKIHQSNKLNRKNKYKMKIIPHIVVFGQVFLDYLGGQDNPYPVDKV